MVVNDALTSTVEPLYKGHPKCRPFKRGGLLRGVKYTWFVKNDEWKWIEFHRFSDTFLAFPEGFTGKGILLVPNFRSQGHGFENPGWTYTLVKKFSTEILENFQIHYPMEMTNFTTFVRHSWPFQRVSTVFVAKASATSIWRCRLVDPYQGYPNVIWDFGGHQRFWWFNIQV